MITDGLCNTLYFSNTIINDFPEIVNEMVKIIQNHGYRVKVLDETDDYWCRDYMPIQLTNKEFVQFIYLPKRYVNTNEMEFISNPAKIQLANKLKLPRYSRIILDGGNIVKSAETAIISDKVFDDNMYQFFDKQSIINQLKADLSAKIIIVPQYPKRKNRNTNGIIRFVDEKTVVINQLKDEPEKEWLESLLKVLDKFGLKYFEMPNAVQNQTEIEYGLYLDFLEIGKLILVPQYGLDEDKKAVETVIDLYGKTHHVIPFKANWIADYGSVFSCIAWCVNL